MATSSYRQILKSAVLTGGASVINVLLGVVRAKLMAVMIGTKGVGLFGVFNSITSLVGVIAGMGISTSGVRQIAEAVGTNDQERVARTAHVLRRTSFVLGLLGMLTLLLLCRPISKATFGDTTHASALALLSVTILCTAVTGGQTALIQGWRRLRDFAELTIWGGVLATILSVPIIYFYRVKGIVPYLMATSILTIGTSWWYARKIKVGSVALPLAAIWVEVKNLLGLGMAFMVSGLLYATVAYLTRVMVMRQISLDASGLYQAAWTLSAVYPAIILTAMGADYYPRLTAVAGDKQEVNHMINEQTEAAILMATPGILGMLTFAPLVIHLTYAASFGPALGILRWQTLGVLFQIIAWPLGYVFPALGCAKTFFWTETASKAVQLGLVWLGMKWFGLSGLGMAFLGLFVFYALLAVIFVHRLTGFCWTKANLQLGFGALISTALVFLATAGGLPSPWGVVIGAMITAVISFYAARKMFRRSGHAGWASVWHKIQTRNQIGSQ